MMSDVLLTIDEEEAKVIERALMVASANVAMFPDIEDLINKVKEARKNGNNNVGKNIKFIPSSYSNADIARDYFADGGVSLSTIHGRVSAPTDKYKITVEAKWKCTECWCLVYTDGEAPTLSCACGNKDFEMIGKRGTIKSVWSE